jgi:glycosyltransferase involved in cell wall biosynthesis
VPKIKTAFIPTEVAGVNFYRMWQPAEALKKYGYPTAVLWYSSKEMDRRNSWELGMTDKQYELKIIKDVEMACIWADVIVFMALHAEHSLDLFRALKKRHHNKKFVMDIDDNVLSIPEYNAAYDHYNHGKAMSLIAVEQMKLSDALFVSTPELGRAYSKFNPNVHVVENLIDTALWRASSPPRHRALNIGWVGGGTHGEDLAIAKPAILNILRDYPKAKFTCLHGAPKFFKHKDGCRMADRSMEYPPCIECGGHDRLIWTHEFKTIKKYPRWVNSHEFNIGIAPLVDNDFNRGKSNLRWLEYSAMGIPTVASRVGHFAETLKDGENVLLAENEEQFEIALRRLLDDPELRDSIGKNAKREVMENWSPGKSASKYIRALESVLAVTNAV